MRRTTARQIAVQLSFALNAGSDVGPEEFFRDEYFKELPSEEPIFSEAPDEEQRNYIFTIVNGVREHADELDDIISRYSKGWKLNRISRTALAILRVALFEIIYMQDIPSAAAINEAVEQAKSFDEPETARYVNGILGGYMRDQAPAEAAPGISAEEIPAPEV